jgi:cyclopropane fatty-acyl-phospholipid synthase-like methyltransferase
VGYFYDPDITLDEAQLAKMEMIGRKLDLKPGQGMRDGVLLAWPPKKTII